jgi:hypothetical protein
VFITIPTALGVVTSLIVAEAPRACRDCIAKLRRGRARVPRRCANTNVFAVGIGSKMVTPWSRVRIGIPDDHRPRVVVTDIDGFDDPAFITARSINDEMTNCSSEHVLAVVALFASPE